MAMSKQKSGSAAKKKASTAKGAVAKKAVAKKPVALKKVLPGKAVKPASKPAKKAAAKPAAAKKTSPKPVPGKKTAAKSQRAAVVVKPQRATQKILVDKKLTKPVGKPSAAAKIPSKPPAQKLAAKKVAAPVIAKTPPAGKPASTEQAVSTKGTMASAATKTPDTVTREDGRYALPATVVIELPANYRPAHKEEYMGPRQLAYFRAKLQKWRDELVEESKQTIDNLRDEVRDVGDEAERATRETENSLELRTRDRYRKLIGKIDKARKRIEEGRYGYCEETDEEIGIERLEARPIATLSLDAQERWEHRQKQMGD
jgi:DnaK suppressor protein